MLPAIQVKRLNAVKLEDQREPTLLSFVLLCRIALLYLTIQQNQKKNICTD